MTQKYTPTTWIGGKTIGTADVMNNMEQGIVGAYDELDKIKKNVGYVTYEDFGAKGDGVTDDGVCIKEAHEYANANKLSVFCPIPKTYYIKDIEDILVKTDVDWNGSSIIIDDRNELIAPVFKLVNDENSITLNSEELTKLTNINKNTINIPSLSGYGDCYVNIYNSNKKQYIREGVNANSGIDQFDQFKINNDGDVLNKISWDFDTITKCVIFKSSKNYITVKNCNFKTISNENTLSDVYIKRGIVVSRNRVIIDNIQHTIEQDVIGKPYSGFIYITNCCDVIVKNTILTPRVYRKNQAQTANLGTYDLGLAYCCDVSFNNLKAFSTSSKVWGVWGGNFIKDLVVENSEINRIDAHCGVFGVTVRNTKIGNYGLTLVGGGTLILDNIDIYAPQVVSFRTDYGAVWHGDIYLTKIRHYATNTSPKIFYMSNKASHDYGYKCYLGDNIISVEDYRIITNGFNINTPIVFDFSNITLGSGTSVKSYYYFTDKVSLKNLSIDDASKGFIVIKYNTLYVRSKKDADVVIYSSDNIYDRFVSIKANTIVNVEDVQLLYQEESTWNASNILINTTLGSNGNDDYCVDKKNIVFEFNIYNCKNVNASVSGMPCSINIDNCTINCILAKNGGTRNILNVNNCDFIPNAYDSRQCFRVNRHATTLNNVVFHNCYVDGNKKITTKDDLLKVYEFFDFIKRTVDIPLKCNISNSYFMNDIPSDAIGTEIYYINENFPNSLSNRTYYAKKGTSSTRQALTTLVPDFYEYIDLTLNKKTYKLGSYWYDAYTNQQI